MFCRNCGKEVSEVTEICMGCGARPSIGNSYCMACGAETNPLAELCIACGSRLTISPKTAKSKPIEPKPVVAKTEETIAVGPEPVESKPVVPKTTVAPTADDISKRSRLATALLALFLGIYGAHQFYAGKVGAGMAMLILGILGALFYLRDTADAILHFFTGLIGPLHLPFPFHYVFIVFLIAIAVWAFVDFLTAVVGRFRDADDKLVKNWGF